MTLLEAAKQAVDALEMMGYPMSSEAWRNAGDEAPPNGRAAIEVRALHRAAVALAEVVRTTSKTVEKINTKPAASIVVPVTPTPAMLARMVETYEEVAEDSKVTDTEVMACVWDAAIAAVKGGAA
jgi:hypothetical protein